MYVYENEVNKQSFMGELSKFLGLFLGGVIVYWVTGGNFNYYYLAESILWVCAEVEEVRVQRRFLGISI
jgi:hypothetical protein